MSNTDDNALVEEQTPDTAAVELPVDDSDSADQSQVEAVSYTHLTLPTKA